MHSTTQVEDWQLALFGGLRYKDKTANLRTAMGRDLRRPRLPQGVRRPEEAHLHGFGQLAAGTASQAGQPALKFSLTGRSPSEAHERATSPAAAAGQ